MNLEQIGGSHALYSDTDLCRLTAAASGAGVYVVDKMTGVTEPDLRRPGTTDGFTYIDLIRQEDWYDGPAAVTIRVIGGPVGGGIMKSQFIDLGLDEEVAMLLLPATPGNNGHMRVGPLQIFRPDSTGEWTNGLLGAPKVALTEAVRDNMSTGKCAMNITPPTPPTSTPVDETEIRHIVLESD